MTGEVMYFENRDSKQIHRLTPHTYIHWIVNIIKKTVVRVIVKARPKFGIQHENNLNETCMTTPAISNNYLFFRTHNHLVAVSNQH